MCDYATSDPGLAVPDPVNRSSPAGNEPAIVGGAARDLAAGLAAESDLPDRLPTPEGALVRHPRSDDGRLPRMDQDTVHLARRLATTLMVVARITTPKRYDSTAWRRAALRIGLELMSVSETWKVMPRVSAT